MGHFGILYNRLYIIYNPCTRLTNCVHSSNMLVLSREKRFHRELVCLVGLYGTIQHILNKKFYQQELFTWYQKLFCILNNTWNDNYNVRNRKQGHKKWNKECLNNNNMALFFTLFFKVQCSSTRLGQSVRGKGMEVSEQ